MTPTRVITAQVSDTGLVNERRAHIAQAAARVFRRKGFHNATIRDIAVEAGLSQGSLYNYVRTKDDILYLVHQDMTAAYARDVERALEDVTEPRARLHAAIAAFIHSMRERRADIALIYQETHALGEESRRAVLAQTQAFIQRFAQLIEEARAAGMALPGAGPLAADIVTFLPVMLSLRAWRLRDIMPGDAAEAELVGFLMRGLGIQDGV
ncbi:TetR/AcrR family transcriptional regulator [Sediminicoccus rosea]|jgi:AcrR family transcriptional regulator|uniref:TetR family transcriptional regulator n=1 Tax=Sediminicoccus rosea TaxID=1225128 RepID=A0ABZ0PJS3_9PROT|nr:TetR family transcriptional regulator [Sediminicoccus rosea]WPB85979.1 TetR family transcriptional regulator [Sediminicoccus rosea]